MAIAKRSFTVVAGSDGTSVQKFPALQSWFFHSVRFIAPKPPRTRLADGSNIVLFDPYLRINWIDFGETLKDSGQNNGRITANQVTTPIWAAIGFARPYALSNKESLYSIDKFATDWEMELGVTDVQIGTPVPGGEWDIDVMIFDGRAGRELIVPLPEGFRLIGNN